MTNSNAPSRQAPAAGRLIVALVLGVVLWLVGTVVSQFVPQVVLGLELEGPTFALVGLIQLLLGPLAVWLALRLVGLGFRDIGATREGWRVEAMVGAAVAVAFGLLQFLVIIPATGGASRSDIVANAAQIGPTWWGVLGFAVQAWCGGLSEELLFRGHLVTLLRRLLGTSRAALVAVVLLVTVLFAAGHGYQGWAGVIDTGLYGGLTLTLLFLWRGRLTACVVAHALWNTIAATVIFLWY